MITHVNGDHARATVRGDGHLYKVTANGPAWSCTCPARGRCAHQIAVGLVVAVDLGGPEVTRPLRSVS